jgi:AcrR family transcriptional regulator
MSHWVVWKTCPDCGDLAAVVWGSDGEVAEFDCRGRMWADRRSAGVSCSSAIGRRGACGDDQGCFPRGLSSPSPRRGGRPRGPSRDEAIRAALLRLLGEVGYGGLTIDALAQAAGVGVGVGVGKATIYRRWRTKQDLIVDSISDLGSLLTVPPDTGSLREDLRQFMHLLAETTRSPVGAMLRSLVPAMHHHPELRARTSPRSRPGTASSRSHSMRVPTRRGRLHLRDPGRAAPHGGSPSSRGRVTQRLDGRGTADGWSVSPGVQARRRRAADTRPGGWMDDDGYVPSPIASRT